MTNDNTTPTPERATMTIEKAFFDKLESYFDFRDEEPETARKLAIDLIQMCSALVIHLCSATGNYDERVTDPAYQAIIGDIIGDSSGKEWASGGYFLWLGAIMLWVKLDHKFSLGLQARIKSLDLDSLLGRKAA